MPDKDYLPKAMDAMLAWLITFVKGLGSLGLATKYDIAPALVTQLQADLTWMKFWVQQRHEEDARQQGITKYFNTIRGMDSEAEPPAPIDFPTPTPPPEVPPGIEKRIRDVARQIKGHVDYAVADGEALGIVAPESTGETPEEMEEMMPVFELKTQAEFRLKAEFRKKGMDGIRFEYRHIGGSWHPAGTLLDSGGRFTVPPSQPGVAEQVEVRGIYIRGNEDIGQFSPAVSAFIAP